MKEQASLFLKSATDIKNLLGLKYKNQVDLPYLQFCLNYILGHQNHLIGDNLNTINFSQTEKKLLTEKGFFAIHKQFINRSGQNSNKSYLFELNKFNNKDLSTNSFLLFKEDDVSDKFIEILDNLSTPKEVIFYYNYLLVKFLCYSKFKIPNIFFIRESDIDRLSDVEYDIKYSSSNQFNRTYCKYLSFNDHEYFKQLQLELSLIVKHHSPISFIHQFEYDFFSWEEKEEFFNLVYPNESLIESFLEYETIENHVLEYKIATPSIQYDLLKIEKKLEERTIYEWGLAMGKYKFELRENNLSSEETVEKLKSDFKYFIESDESRNHILSQIQKLNLKYKSTHLFLSVLTRHFFQSPSRVSMFTEKKDYEAEIEHVALEVIRLVNFDEETPTPNNKIEKEIDNAKNHAESLDEYIRNKLNFNPSISGTRLEEKNIIYRPSDYVQKNALDFTLISNIVQNFHKKILRN